MITVKLFNAPSIRRRSRSDRKKKKSELCLWINSAFFFFFLLLLLMYVCVWVFRDTQKNCKRIEEYKKKKKSE